MDFKKIAQELIDCNDNHDKQLDIIRQYILAFSKQSSFHVACLWKEHSDEMEPFVGYHNEEIPCYYVFTELELAYQFAQYYKLTNPEGKSYAMTFPMNEFLEHLQFYEERGVQLISFNEGEHYFISDLGMIMNILTETNQEESLPTP